MIVAFAIAGMTVFIVAGACLSIWFWDYDEARYQQRRKVERWRRDRVAEFPEVRLDGAYSDAIEHTFTRANIQSVDDLIAALDRRPAELEVVA